MYILKNAWISMTRNKGRNLLIGIIILVIAVSASISLAIQNSASKLIESYENSYDITATVTMDRKSMMGNGMGKMERQDGEKPTEEERNESMQNMQEIFESASNISVADIEKYGSSDYVKSYYYTESVSVNSTNLEKASTNGNQMNRPGGNFNNISSADFTLIGYSSLTAMEDFISGKYTITEGEVSSDLEGNNCVINSELATLNDISVGDTIIVVDPNNEVNTLELTVTGIYEEQSDEMAMFTNSVNTIITNVNVIEKLISVNSELKVSVNPTFILKDKDVIDAFSEELYSLGLSEYLTVSTNLETIENSTSTISNVASFAKTFLIIILLIGGIVLFVINMINIRERKYEIGVLRTIGMKKSLLTLQFILELFIVAFISLLIGTGIGSVLSVPVSNSLLESEIESSQNEQENIMNNFGGNGDKFNNIGRPDNKFNGVHVVQAFDSIDAVVDIKVLFELLGIGLLLTLISGIASMISIQKFSPLTILKERS